MKIIRYAQDGAVKYGVLENEQIQVITGDIFGDFNVNGEKLSLLDVQILPPVVPTKVVCLGLNYLKHAQEIGFEIPKEPLLFLKPASSVIGYGDVVVKPDGLDRLDYEAEMAIVMAQTCTKVTEADALDYVLGYTCLNDVSARDYQNKDGQWTRAKGFDTFCPIGPVISTDVVDPDNLAIKARLNGKLVQDSSTADLIFKCAETISYISHIMTLEPGDVIATGTPEGIGPMQPGDVIEVEIEDIGVLKNTVAKA